MYIAGNVCQLYSRDHGYLRNSQQVRRILQEGTWQEVDQHGGLISIMAARQRDVAVVVVVVVVDRRAAKKNRNAERNWGEHKS